MNAHFSTTGLTQFFRCLVLILGFSLVTACGGGGLDDENSEQDADTDSGGGTEGGSVTNTAPSADAGEDRYSYVAASVQLDATGSSDADGDNLSYQWSFVDKPDGSSATLNNASSSTPVLVPDVAGIYQLELEVSDGQATSDTASVQITVADWLINTTERSEFITSGNTGVLVNVQSITDSGEGSNELLTVSATGIPNYQVTMTQYEIDKLNNRPKANVDFDGGATSAMVGDIIKFGQDIGYKIIHIGCELGYWPAGPECPSNQSKVQSVPAQPEPTSSSCSTSLNSIGIMLNGTSVFNWDDGASYNDQNVWNNLAPVFEQYDVDMCEGHAQQQGDYHHHMFSVCLQDLLGDTGNGHSPIYGFAADGYPIYGPYYMQGMLAKPSWVKRSYGVNSESGCGVARQRTCQLVDQYDLSKGTQTVTSGPATNATVTSQSSNSIDAVPGVYFEDYYWDSSLAAMGGEYLDQHNGHDHDALGYHYHVTAEEVDGRLSPVFPYQIGPTFYGELPNDTFAICGQ